MIQRQVLIEAGASCPPPDHEKEFHAILTSSTSSKCWAETITNELDQPMMKGDTTNGPQKQSQRKYDNDVDL